LSLWMKPRGVKFKMKAIQQYFSVVPILALYLKDRSIPFESTDEILIGVDSNESHFPLRLCGTS